MKKILSNLKFVAFLLILGTGTLMAQQEAPAEKKEKVVIITKTTDENGNVNTERIVKENINGVEVYNVKKKGQLKRKARIINGDHYLIGSVKNTPNRACLGVRIGQKKIVENINGEEIIEMEGDSEIGVAIIDVINDSGAEDAGLLSEDVITNINGQSVASVQDVLDVLKPFDEGGVVTVAYLRDGQPTQVEAVLKACASPVIEEIELERETDIDWEERAIEDIEIELENGELIPSDIEEILNEEESHFNIERLNDENIYFIKSKDVPNRACLGVMIGQTKHVENINGVETKVVEGTSAKGVNILDVIAGSGAEDAGLLKDDVITNINGQSVLSIQDVLDIVGDFETGGVVMVDYLRDGQNMQAEATLKACNNGFVIKEVAKELDVDWEEDEMERQVIKVEEIEIQGEKPYKIIVKKRKKDIEAEPVKETVVEEEGADSRTENSKPSNNILDLEEIDIFPNPTDSKFTLQFSAAPVSTDILITDISGRQIYQEEVVDFDGSYSKVIDISRAAKGTLLLSIRQGNRIFTEKIILQ